MPRTRSIAWSEIKLGVVGVVAVLLVTILVVALGGQGGFWWQRYPLKMQFSDAQGLKPGAVVRVSGKEVGTVTAVEFAGAQIDVALELNKDLRPLVTTDSVGTIGSFQALGESIIDIKASPTGTPLNDWRYFKSVEVGTMADLTTTAAGSLKEASDLIADVRAGRGTLGKLVADDALYRELNQFIIGTRRHPRPQPGAWHAREPAPGSVRLRGHEGVAANLQAMTRRIDEGQGALGRFLNDEAMGSRSATDDGSSSRPPGSAAEQHAGPAADQSGGVADRLTSMSTRLDQVVGGLEEQDTDPRPVAARPPAL